MARKIVRLTKGLIIANTPEFTDRGDLWWTRNQKDILRGSLLNPYWKRNALVIAEHQHLPMNDLTTTLGSLEYKRTSQIENRGEYKIQGGTLTIAPINQKTELLIEYTGEMISGIWERTDSDLVPKKSSAKNPLQRLHDGDYVTHRDHGIGIWRGTQENTRGTYFVIEYAGLRGRSTADTLLVPEAHAEKLHPYIGFRAPTIHRLGGNTWSRTLRKATHETKAFAENLLRTEAMRAQETRPPYHIDNTIEQRLRETFPHELTPDQEQAIAQIYQDLTRPNPMDHLLMGDVGFGKTEVAAHAMLQVALSGKQIALLSPTTILAAQHEETLAKRFAEFPIVVRGLSRLKTKKETDQTVKEIRAGKVDIVIGTHRLLSNDIQFHDLGLLIIDEEQRFGVAAKNKLKERRSHIDILTMSATPLPRTLHLALGNVKQLSTLRTAPEMRRPPKTEVLPYTTALAAKAIEKELRRGGQVYFLANRINKIPDLKNKLQAAFPKARFGVLHGRLGEEEIARTMNAFRGGTIDVLISTTIIENGIDLHSANTLIVHDATYLGLAEAHQLRGRIGRSDKEAYAYFCYPKRFEEYEEYLKLPAFKRLIALLETQYLGSGEEIAHRDLELRGAGNILGKSQSGTAHSVGLGIYSDLLREAVEKLKKHL